MRNPITLAYRYAVRLKQGVDRLLALASSDYKSPKVLMGRTLATINSGRRDVTQLRDVEFQVFSQFGDDGIIQWLVQQLPIEHHTFIEFGVEDYTEANTRFLLVNNQWSGLVLDGDPQNIDRIRRDQISRFFDLQSECAFITTDNINSLVTRANFASLKVGLLSIDIDGNDYWVWEALTSVEPSIVICEYNCLFGFESPWTIKYDPSFVRGTNYPFSFYGTSLRSACDLAESRGLTFIGCNAAGNNAYFISKDLQRYLSIPEVTPEQGYQFSSFSEANHPDGLPCRGPDKIQALDGLPVGNTRSGCVECFDADAVIQSLRTAGKLKRNRSSP
jgi:hypothetical protein